MRRRRLVNEYYFLLAAFERRTLLQIEQEKKTRFPDIFNLSNETFETAKYDIPKVFHSHFPTSSPVPYVLVIHIPEPELKAQGPDERQAEGIRA